MKPPVARRGTALPPKRHAPRKGPAARMPLGNSARVPPMTAGLQTIHPPARRLRGGRVWPTDRCHRSYREPRRVYDGQRLPHHRWPLRQRGHASYARTRHGRAERRRDGRHQRDLSQRRHRHHGRQHWTLRKPAGTMDRRHRRYGRWLHRRGDDWGRRRHSMPTRPGSSTPCPARRRPSYVTPRRRAPYWPTRPWPGLSVVSPGRAARAPCGMSARRVRRSRRPSSGRS